jgi:hypothetical protein
METDDNYLKHWLRLKNEPPPLPHKGPYKKKLSNIYIDDERYLKPSEAKCYYYLLIGTPRTSLAKKTHVSYDRMENHFSAAKTRLGLYHLSDDKMLELLRKSSFIKNYENAMKKLEEQHESI